MARPPRPQSRKTLSGDDSGVPPGFTIQKYVGKSGDEKTHWRCSGINQNAITGEWRRCCQHRQKYRCALHKARAKHMFDIPRGTDDGFPDDFDQRR
jgi:hypothetical protein